MWRRLENLIQRLDGARYRRGIERALALHLRGEVRSDGLKLKKLSTRLEIEWLARDIHSWDRNDPPDRKAWLFFRQTLADTEAAITRLFQSLPQVDVIALTVLESNSESVIMAGTVSRSALEPDTELSVGMRLWQRGITYRTPPGSMPLAPSDDLDVASGRAGERIPTALLTKHAGPTCADNYVPDMKISVPAQFVQNTVSAIIVPDARKDDHPRLPRER
jgi:hypothetical protein